MSRLRDGSTGYSRCDAGVIDPSNPRWAAYVAITKALIEDFRAHHGEVTSGPFAGRPALLLTTTGSKNNEPRLVPLIYTPNGDHYVIAASSSGLPVATVEVGKETFTARARVTEGDERDRLWAEHVAAHPGIDAFDECPTRVIPVVVLERLG